MEAIRDVRVMIEASSEFESDEDALEALVQLKDLDFADVFLEKETQLDPEEGQSISISFYNEDTRDSLHLYTAPDSNLQIWLHLSDDTIDNGSQILNDILPLVGPISIDDIAVYRKFEQPFHEFDLPLSEDSELNVIGIRIEIDDAQYIIQEGEEEGTQVSMISSGLEFDEVVPEDYIRGEANKIAQFLEEHL